ncbi:MAG: hypothetical protein LBI56_00475 [Puniceicoccales bacterium]|jgi:hypothetical protein|nr:hypothetical protein [Puniceicoccales bacterium]
MKSVETFGIVIGVQRDRYFGRITSLDIFTVDYGIMRWFSRLHLDAQVDYLFASVEIIGDKTTETAGNLKKIKVIAQNASAMQENDSYEQGKLFMETLRKITFDGFPLEDLFLITGQAIKNFVAGFNADVVLLKAVYLLCKEEGYAVDAGWMKSLGSTGKTLACDVIFSPLSLGQISNATLDRICFLTDSLIHWALAL